MADPILRPLTAADLPALAALEEACFSHPWTERQLAADLENDLLTHLGAVSPEGALLGYTHFSNFSNLFRKKNRLSPAEYRKQFMEGRQGG